MQTISVCCVSTPITVIARKLEKMFWSHRRPSGRKQFEDGPVQAFIYLLMTSKESKNFSFASVTGMAQRFGAHPSTVEHWLRILLKARFIVKGRKFIRSRGCWERGFYICAHEWVLDVLRTIKGIVVRVFQDDEEDAGQSIQEAVQEAGQKVQKVQVVGKLHSHLTIKNGLNGKEIPPTPQRGITADATKERENEQQSEAQGTAPLRDGSTTLQQAAPTEGAEKTDAAESDGLTPAPWQAALALLLQQLPQDDFEVWIKSICVSETESGLQLDCPDRYAMAWVQEHFATTIRDALQRIGITRWHFSFGRQEAAKKKERATAEAQARDQQVRKLATQSLEKQFAALKAAYPRKTTGTWSAWQTFRRLKKRGELPDIGQLLYLLQEQISSDDWQRDAGRWIPGLNKWLKNKPWWNFGSKKR